MTAYIPTKLVVTHNAGGRSRVTPHRIITLLITSVAIFMVTLDNLVVTTALPSIRVDLGASLEDLEWTVNAYTLAFAVFLLTGAALGDRFGRRRMFLIGIALFTGASAFAALAPSTDALIAARALQGLGGAIVAPLTLTLLSEAFPAEKRGLALGIWSGIGGLAVATGPLVGGAIIEGISWQWIFWVNVPVGLALLPLARRGLVESHGPAGRLDLPGVALATAGLLGVVYATVRGNALGWGSTTVVGSYVAGAAAAGRLRPVGAPQPGADAAAALLPLARLRRHLGRVAGDVVRDLRLDLPARPVLPDRVGLRAARGRPAHAALDRHADARRPDRRRAVGQDRLAAADGRRARRCRRSRSCGWRRSRASTSPYIELVPAFVLGGTGMALVFSPVANAILGAVKPHEAGQASGANNAIRELGGVLGVAVLAAVFSATGGYESGQAFVDGLAPALWVGAAVLAAGAVSALLVPGKAREKAPAVAGEPVPVPA